ncbi:sulfatase-like hydrolase/transferase [Flavitalea sp.]|nr:sulfatase-like hydrolase/transferase [Flavitalea sp.]
MKTATRYLSLIILISLTAFSVDKLKKNEITVEKSSGVKGDPNVIIIFMDDMGYGDPVCYGGGPYQTPNIDALAAQGIRFTNFYAAQAVCTASRSALMTGCYPTRIGISGAINHSSKIALNPEEQTIAELLKLKGYKTAMVGKWHWAIKSLFCLCKMVLMSSTVCLIQTICGLMIIMGKK